MLESGSAWRRKRDGKRLERGRSSRRRNNWIGSYEARHVGISPQEDRGGTAGAVGEVQGGAAEGGLEPAEPITRIVLHNYPSEEYQQFCCLW
jgi:hypothetical protein